MLIYLQRFFKLELFGLRAKLENKLPKIELPIYKEIIIALDLPLNIELAIGTPNYPIFE